MRFDAVLFDNGGTLTHRTSPVAMVRTLAARFGADISEEEAARYWRRSREHSRTLMAEKRLRRNLSRADHREAYVAGYAPFEEIAPGLAELMYDEWKTSPLTMATGDVRCVRVPPLSSRTAWKRIGSPHRVEGFDAGRSRLAACPVDRAGGRAACRAGPGNCLEPHVGGSAA